MSRGGGWRRRRWGRGGEAEAEAEAAELELRRCGTVCSSTLHSFSNRNYVLK